MTRPLALLEMRRAVFLSTAITCLPLSRSCFGSWSHHIAQSRHRRRLLVTIMTMAAVVPRAAVSVVVRVGASCDTTTTTPATYVLVQRGKEPNKGMWSLPGGKIELGESTLHAAQRELWEETRLSPQDWYPRAFCVSDAIHRNKAGEVQYHYVIAQCFCALPFQKLLIASDDAADAKWFTLAEIQRLQKLTPGVIQVIETLETMYEKGVLPTTKSSIN